MRTRECSGIVKPRKLNRWMGKQHLALWRGRCYTQTGSRIDLGVLTWLQATDYCPVTGLKPRLLLACLPDITLRRHLCIMRLGNNPICRRCGSEDETPVHILYECEDLVSLRHNHLGFFFLHTEDINTLTPNDPYRGRTASLTSKVAFYIFIQQIYVLNILNMVCILRFFSLSSKCSLFHNSNVFGFLYYSHFIYRVC